MATKKQAHIKRKKGGIKKKNRSPKKAPIPGLRERILKAELEEDILGF